MKNSTHWCDINELSGKKTDRRNNVKVLLESVESHTAHQKKRHTTAYWRENIIYSIHGTRVRNAINEIRNENVHTKKVTDSMWNWIHKNEMREKRTGNEMLNRWMVQIPSEKKMKRRKKKQHREIKTKYIADNTKHSDLHSVAEAQDLRAVAKNSTLQ